MEIMPPSPPPILPPSPAGGAPPIAPALPPVHTIDEYLSPSARQSITPDKSLERIDSYAKYLFTIVTIATGLLGSAGLLSADDSRRVFLWVPLLFLCSSLAVAVWAIAPRVNAFDPTNDLDLLEYFNKLIKKKGRFVKYAGFLFALGLFSLSFPLSLPHYLGPRVGFFVYAPGMPDPKSGKNSIHGKLEIVGLDTGSVVEVRVSGVGGAKPIGTLFSYLGTPTPAGKADLQFECDLGGAQLVMSEVAIRDASDRTVFSKILKTDVHGPSVN